MKYAGVALFAMSLGALPASSYASVEVVEVRPSTQNARITVLKAGAQQQGVKLAIFAKDGKQKLVLTTDSIGMAKLPHLAPGQYCVVASTSPTLWAELCLQIVAGQKKGNPSTFTMELSDKPPRPLTFEERLAAAEKASTALVTGTLSGTVSDPSGGVISRASLAIYRHGSKDTAHPVKATSDNAGRFSVRLRPAKYTVVIQSPGFETQFVTVEVFQGSVERTLNVNLNLGKMTETVAVAEANTNH